MSKVAQEINYEDYHKMICQKGHAINKTYHIEFDEVVAQCNLIFVKCLGTYDKRKSSFLASTSIDTMRSFLRSLSQL